MARLDMSTRDTVEYSSLGDGADSLFELGLRYCSGREGSCDLVQAHKWFNLAAMRGNQDAKVYRAELARDMSKADVAKAQKLAREWLKLH